MFAFQESLEFDVPASTVWPYLVAFEQVPLWEHGVLEVRKVTPGPVGVGTRVTARRMYAGRETRLEGPIVEFVNGRSATIALRGGPLLESRVTYAVHAIDSRRARVTYRATGQLRGPLRLLNPILPMVGRAEARKNLVRLRRRISAGIPPDADTPRPGP
jgi:Polyketide cyclase / dehydrase and lipid transport